MKNNTKLKKRFFLIALSLAILAGLFTSCNSGILPNENATVSEEPTAEPSAIQPGSEKGSEKTIDIILVAGQSNATGTTKVNATAAYAILPELENTGYPSVLTAGVLRSTDASATAGYIRRNLDWQATRLGMGKFASYMGPEVGMAKELSMFYEGIGKTAGILKYGHGGTSLLNDTSESNQYGNWVPPSYAEKKGYAYEGATGGLYREFLQVVEEKLKSLESLGYTDFNILGLYWMQGEQDRKSANDYKEAFLCLVEDLRSDLSEVVRSVTGGDDKGVSELPIWVGTISQTFNSALDSDQLFNKLFIKMQKGLADAENKIFVVDHSTFDINVKVDGQTKVVGSDNCHWNQTDHIQIGRNVGWAILKYYHFIEE